MGIDRWKNRGAGWVAAQLIMIALLVFSPPLGSVAIPAAVPIAAVMGVAGGFLMGFGAIMLGRDLTPFPTPLPGSPLIRRGIYRFVRHPIYGGLILGGGAWALWRSSGLHMVLAAFLAVLLNAKANREERDLSQRFADYSEYRRATRKFIPWLV